MEDTESETLKLNASEISEKGPAKTIFFNKVGVKYDNVTLFHFWMILLASFNFFLILSYDNLERPYLIENRFGIKKDISTNVSRVQAAAFMVGFFTNIAMGPIYDIFGRKRPWLLFHVLLSIGLFMAATVRHMYPDYQIAEILITASIFATVLCPVTPDYIHQDSYGVANMLKVCMKKIGVLVACFG